MFLELAHTKLDVFKVSKDFVIQVYHCSKKIPVEEKFGMISQIRRAALSVHLNICEGCSRKSAVERKRFFEISRGSLIEVDTAFDIAISLNFIRIEELDGLDKYTSRLFQLLSKLIRT